MTRLPIVYSFVVLVALPSLAVGQNAGAGNPPSRYAPAGANAGAQQPGRVYGPQPSHPAPQNTAKGGQTGGGYPVRMVAGQQPIGQPGVGGAAIPAQDGVPANAPANPQAPEWAVRMSADEQKWIDDVLRFWEARSDKVKTFECKFKRWDYDAVFGPKTGEAKTYAEGAIKYAHPDKGLFRVEKLLAYVAPAKPGDKATHVAQDPSFGEHWICDGEVVYAFEAPKKQLTVTKLPPQMQHQAIADGPLPFLFGARAETIKARYWIRGLPEDVKQELLKNLEGGSAAYYCLEAVPKARQDAQNFNKVWIVLDKEEFLPQIIEVFAPNYDPQRNPSRQTYVFAERKTDQAIWTKFAVEIAKGLDPLKLFHREFFEPKLPAGWKRVESEIPGAPPQQAAGPTPAPRPAAPIAR